MPLRPPAPNPPPPRYDPEPGEPWVFAGLMVFCGLVTFATGFVTGRFTGQAPEQCPDPVVPRMVAP